MLHAVICATKPVLPRNLCRLIFIHTLTTMSITPTLISILIPPSMCLSALYWRFQLNYFLFLLHGSHNQPSPFVK